jgi:hypothetical protein
MTHPVFYGNKSAPGDCEFIAVSVCQNEKNFASDRTIGKTENIARNVYVHKVYN